MFQTTRHTLHYCLVVYRPSDIWHCQFGWWKSQLCLSKSQRLHVPKHQDYVDSNIYPLANEHNNGKWIQGSGPSCCILLAQWFGPKETQNWVKLPTISEDIHMHIQLCYTYTHYIHNKYFNHIHIRCSLYTYT